MRSCLVRLVMAATRERRSPLPMIPVQWCLRYIQLLHRQRLKIFNITQRLIPTQRLSCLRAQMAMVLVGSTLHFITRKHVPLDLQ